VASSAPSKAGPRRGEAPSRRPSIDPVPPPTPNVIGGRVGVVPLPSEVEEIVGTTVSLYSGAGGLDIGFAAAGFRPVWANDIDPIAVATYNQLFDDHAARDGDIHEQRDIPGEGAADLVVGGPPCQGFSVAGKMDPDDPRSRHVWDFLDVVERVKPRAWCMENVKALAENRRWTMLLHGLIERGEEIGDGYRVTLLVLNASHFGVPQARERMFLIGMANGAEVEVEPTTEDAPPSVGDVLALLPPYGEPGNDTKCPARVTPARKPVLRRSPYAGMLFNGQGRPLNLDAPAPTLPASMGGNRTPIIDQEQLDDGSDPWAVDYHHRLWVERKPPLKRVPPRLRRLTLEEAAAIQTFPRKMQLRGTLGQQFRQIGNAVPPGLAYHVALGIRRALDQNQADEAVEGALELVA
jgi:DNA (cytosine-5)-methyltransferase 1